MGVDQHSLGLGLTMPLLDLVCIECWTGTVGAASTEDEIRGFGDISIGKSESVEEGMEEKVSGRLGTDCGVTIGAEERGRTTSSASEVIGACGEGMV